MSRASHRLPILLALLVLLLLAAGGCSGDDGGEAGSADDRRSTTTDERDDDTDSGEHEQDDEDEPADPTAVPEPVPAGELPPIVVTTPAPFANLYRSFVLTGTAQVHEGDLRWAILDASLKPMAQGTTTASCGAPCRGRFRVRIPLTQVGVGSWELHVWQPPVAEEDPPRMHDTMVPVTVTAQPVTNAPAPGTVPPGGPPQGG